VLPQLLARRAGQRVLQKALPSSADVSFGRWTRSNTQGAAPRASSTRTSGLIGRLANADSVERNDLRQLAVGRDAVQHGVERLVEQSRSITVLRGGHAR